MLESIGATCRWGMKRPAHTDTKEAAAASSEREAGLCGTGRSAGRERTSPAGRVPRAKGSDGRKACARLLRSKRRKILPVHAKDECTRRTYREMYAEHSSVSAKDFPERPVKEAPLPIRTIQTDSAEFTGALPVAGPRRKTLLEEALIERRIAYHRIRIAAPRRSGKAERRYRTDEQRFCKRMRTYSPAARRRQPAVCRRASNAHIITRPGMRPPNQLPEL